MKHDTIFFGMGGGEATFSFCKSAFLCVSECVCSCYAIVLFCLFLTSISGVILVTQLASFAVVKKLQRSLLKMYVE